MHCQQFLRSPTLQSGGNERRMGSGLVRISTKSIQRLTCVYPAEKQYQQRHYSGHDLPHVNYCRLRACGDCFAIALKILYLKLSTE